MEKLKKLRQLIHGIKNCRLSSSYKVFTLINVQCNLIGKRFAIGNFSYHQRCVQAYERDNETI
jgi:hypothetical protein